MTVRLTKLRYAQLPYLYADSLNHQVAVLGPPQFKVFYLTIFWLH